MNDRSEVEVFIIGTVEWKPSCES